MTNKEKQKKRKKETIYSDIRQLKTYKVDRKIVLTPLY